MELKYLYILETVCTCVRQQGQLRQPIYPDFTSACNFLRKEPHIACRGHRGHFEADLEAAEVIEIDLEADLEADLEVARGR